MLIECRANGNEIHIYVTADLHFNIVPVENFHGFTFETQKCEAIPAGDKTITNESCKIQNML